MKKIALCMFLSSSLFMTNAVRPEEFIHTKKNNSEKPRRFSAAVPPCPEDMSAYLAYLEVLQASKNHTSNYSYNKNHLSGSQELERCP